MNEQHETQTTVEPHSRFSVSELISGLPLLASGFAFMYVVGYFLAFDLAWFAFLVFQSMWCSLFEPFLLPLRR